MPEHQEQGDDLVNNLNEIKDSNGLYAINEAAISEGLMDANDVRPLEDSLEGGSH